MLPSSLLLLVVPVSSSLVQLLSRFQTYCHLLASAPAFKYIQFEKLSQSFSPKKKQQRKQGPKDVAHWHPRKMNAYKTVNGLIILWNLERQIITFASKKDFAPLTPSVVTSQQSAIFIKPSTWSVPSLANLKINMN